MYSKMSSINSILCFLAFTIIYYIDCKSIYSCEEVQISVCKNLDKDGYLHASFPNFVGETSQEQAKHTLNGFSDLISSQCSKELPIFLCSVYLPICKPGLDLRIPPCRELCEVSRQSCEPLIIKYSNNTWPHSLDCNQYPSRNDGQLCIGPPTKKENKKEELPMKKKADHLTIHRHENVEIQCGINQKIHIRKVRHHPHSKSCCPTASFAMLSNHCNGKQICPLKVTKTFFGRHCYEKTMNLKFRCVPKSYKVSTNIDVPKCNQEVIQNKNNQ